MRKTKIVCTLGPASRSEQRLSQLLDAGIDVIRLNFSHGSQEEHRQNIERIRKVSESKQQPVAILQDLAGPKIRIGTFDKDHIRLKPGQPFVLTSKGVIGDTSRVSVSYPKLPEEVQEGDHILLADGSVELLVKQVKAKDIICEVFVGGVLSAKKGINLPGRSLSITALTEKDKADLKFGLQNGIDVVAMSFVRNKSDIMNVIQTMERFGKRIPVIAKIEKHEALDNIDEIVEIVDGIMVARGDLAVETPLERVPIVQKMLIQKSNEAAKPVITATQMLKSMVDNPRPTRAEANDVANAVIDGTDAVMLSEETAVGKYPVAAVKTMSRILKVTESSRIAARPRPIHAIEGPTSIAQAVSHAAYQMALDLKAAAIITPTQSGSTPQIVSSYRPKMPIIALSPSEEIIRRMNLIRGVFPIISEPYLTSDDMMEHAKEQALQSGLVKLGDVVIITAGIPIGIPGTTNLIKAEVLR